MPDGMKHGFSFSMGSSGCYCDFEGDLLPSDDPDDRSYDIEDDPDLDRERLFLLLCYYFLVAAADLCFYRERYESESEKSNSLSIRLLGLLDL